jgi:FSR family fosmidomycin resistance protein-like MFS transporter
MYPTAKIKSSMFIVLCSMHAFVDCGCAMVFSSLLISATLPAKSFISLVIIYNILAFGLQTVFGYMIDKTGFARWCAAAGPVSTSIALILLPQAPVAAACIAGIGNALFHVGGAPFAIAATPGKATAPALFVAPGAAGLFCGTVLGKSGNFFFLPMALVLITGAIAIWNVCRVNKQITYSKRSFQWRVVAPLLFLLFFSVTVRSLAGLALATPWKSNLLIAAGLAGAAVFGKAFGGIVADKAGWLITGTVCLTLSALFQWPANSIPVLAVLSMLFLQATMGLTLAAMVSLLRAYPATAFGLCSLALLCGALPMFSQVKTTICQPGVISILILVSGIALFYALKGLRTVESAQNGLVLQTIDNSQIQISSINHIHQSRGGVL